MRRGFAPVVVGLLFAGCAADVPGYKHERPGCYVPTSIPGKTRIRPTEAQVLAAWNALELRKDQYFEYWFEDASGNAEVGISDGSGHWEATLIKNGEGYVHQSKDWTLELVCVG